MAKIEVKFPNQMVYSPEDCHCAELQYIKILEKKIEELEKELDALKVYDSYER